MEIDIPRRLLVLPTAALVTLTLALIGVAVSPRDAGGHPLLLTPQRRAILRYLQWCREWADHLADLEGRLDEVMPESPGSTPQPLPAPGDLYRRAQQAEGALRTAAGLQLDAERAHVPLPMVGLHSLVTAAAQAHTAWAEATVAYVGAPSVQAASGLVELRQAAVEAMATLQKALDAAGG